MQPTFKTFQHRTDEAGNSFLDLEISVLTLEKPFIFLLTLPASTNPDLSSTVQLSDVPKLLADEINAKEQS